jgi:hypothetical protein
MICLYIDSICILSYVCKAVLVSCQWHSVIFFWKEFFFLCLYLIRSRIICLFPKSIINA